MSPNDPIALSKQTGLTCLASHLDFRDQTVLITGGADGIGLSAAHALHLLGAHVIALDVQEEKLKQLAENYKNTRITTLHFDLSETAADAYAALAEKIISSSPTGKIDAYIMNAGVVKLGSGKGVSGVPGQEFRTLIQINAASHADIFRAIAGNLSEDARIVVTTSPIVGRADINTPGYAVSKATLEAFANNIGGELSGTQIKISGYVPPPVQNFLRTDLKPSEPYYAHPHGEDIVELPLRLASRSLKAEFNGKVIAMGYDHLRKKDGINSEGKSFDYMPRDPSNNAFFYDLRLRNLASGGGDSGETFMRWNTGSSRLIQGLGKTPDMQVDFPLNKIYQAPNHISKHRQENPEREP